jgi:acetyl-CoA carboxylase carboxyl transferase subunit alpha
VKFDKFIQDRIHIIERGQSGAIARNLFEMSTLATPIISVVIGEGGSGGALAIGVADKMMRLEIFFG